MASNPDERKAGDAAAGVSEKSVPETKAHLGHSEVGDAKLKLGVAKTSTTARLEGSNATNAVESQAPWTAMQQLLLQALPNFVGVGGILGIISSYAQGAVLHFATLVSLRFSFASHSSTPVPWPAFVACTCSRPFLHPNLPMTLPHPHNTHPGSSTLRDFRHTASSFSYSPHPFIG